MPGQPYIVHLLLVLAYELTLDIFGIFLQVFTISTCDLAPLLSLESDLCQKEIYFCAYSLHITTYMYVHSIVNDTSEYIGAVYFTFAPWPFRPNGYCCCLRPPVCQSVCLSVCPSVRQLYLVRTIIRHRFELESPNFYQTYILGYSWLAFKMGVIDLDLHFRPLWLRILGYSACPRNNSSQIWAWITKFAPNIMGYSWLVLKMGVIDLDLQGHFGHFYLEFWVILIVCAITRHWFGLESSNLHQICIMGYSWRVLKMGVIELDLQGHFGHLT